MGKKRVQGARKVARRPKKSVKPTQEDTDKDIKLSIGSGSLKVPISVEAVLTCAPVWPSQSPSAAEIEKFKMEFKEWLAKLKATA